ncbi:MAG TPA: HAMP domain-containing sensor histidine kinase [Myxococcota bacterium]|nr:HAMP domain-containing sensor histidine kinase [Myxococcota bacterium]HRY95008.1 HAMP domain-containing sensor histidine kinase [Myxococcota bacterium]HSA22831.1 HAMP domain-containing sensor histidine kinase [Myxococcota bacterium]
MSEPGAAEARARERAQFIATVSHDLKTPLNAVVGFTSVLLLDLQGTEAGKKLGLVYDSARLMLERINALVELHRLEAGVLAPQPDWLFPGELLLQAAEEARAAAEGKGLALAAEPRGGPARLRTDLRLVQRALRELVSNAVRFSRQGEIRLGLGLEAGGRPGARRVRFWVHDPGVGMKPAQLAELRAAFEPAQAPLAWPFQGLGLGLALARQAARALGGWLEVEAPPEHGCRFSLVLELDEADLES